MSIEQNIIDAVSISKVTKLPVLFMSNPGLGKTTIIMRYAQKQGMHLETLIGSRFTPEEISGYQVNNGGDHLVQWKKLKRIGLERDFSFSGNSDDGLAV